MIIVGRSTQERLDYIKYVEKELFHEIGNKHSMEDLIMDTKKSDREPLMQKYKSCTARVESLSNEYSKFQVLLPREGITEEGKKKVNINQSKDAFVRASK